MNKKELKKELILAKNYREYGQYPEAIAILHKVINQYPETKYYCLLAITYMESGEFELALEYVDKVLSLEPANKEMYELKAKVYEIQKDYRTAETMYSKAIEIDPNFFEARKGLVDMYYKKEKDYHKTILQCESIFKSHNIFELKKEDKNTEYQWFFSFKNPLINSYILLKKYTDAIRVIIFDKKIIRDYIGNGKDEYTLTKQDRILYKLYYLLKDEAGLAKQKNIWKEYYKASDSYINGMEKDAIQGYILNTNRDNYEVASDGTIL